MKKFSVSLSNIIKEFSLEILVAGADHNTINIEVADLNRPGLQLSGFFDYFDSDRIQIIGKSESSFLNLSLMTKSHNGLTT